MTSEVAVLELDENVQNSLEQALNLVRKTEDLNTPERSVVIKPGIFDHKKKNHPTVNIVDAIINCFNRAPQIFIVESDNYRGTGSERLQIYKELFTERVTPFNLSNDSDTRSVRLADQEMNLSHILFKPNVLVDTHILRSFESGSILKNLFGCIPTPKKAKYHKILPTLLADVYEAIGGVALAVLDGTYFWHGVGDAPVEMNILLVGRDAVAVETVGATLGGLNPQKMPVIQEFAKRGLGEGNLENIKLVGASLERIREKSVFAAMTQKKLRAQRKGPQTWGGQMYRALEALIREGFFKHPNKRTIDDVVKALEAKGLSTKDKENNISNALARRVKKGTLKKSRVSNGWSYWRE